MLATCRLGVVPNVVNAGSPSSLRLPAAWPTLAHRGGDGPTPLVHGPHCREAAGVQGSFRERRCDRAALAARVAMRRRGPRASASRARAPGNCSAGYHSDSAASTASAASRCCEARGAWRLQLATVANSEGRLCPSSQNCHAPSQRGSGAHKSPRRALGVFAVPQQLPALRAHRACWGAPLAVASNSEVAESTTAWSCRPLRGTRGAPLAFAGFQERAASGTSRPGGKV